MGAPLYRQTGHSPLCSKHMRSPVHAASWQAAHVDPRLGQDVGSQGGNYALQGCGCEATLWDVVLHLSGQLVACSLQLAASCQLRARQTACRKKQCSNRGRPVLLWSLGALTRREMSKSIQQHHLLGYAKCIPRQASKPMPFMRTCCSAATKTSRPIVRSPQPCRERERQRATVTRSRQSSQKPRTTGGSESHSCSNQSVRKNVWRPVASAASGLGTTLLWMMGRGLKIASPSHEVLYRHSTVASTCRGARYIQYRTVLCTKRL